MITIKNILNEYPKLDQAVLPDFLQANEFDELKKYLPHYGKDKDIDELINAFVDGLNENSGIEKKTSKKDKAKGRSRTIRKATSTKIRPAESKETEPDKEAKKSIKNKRLKTIRKATRAKVRPVKQVKTSKKALKKGRKIAARKSIRNKPVVKPVKLTKTKQIREKKAVLNSIPAWLMTVRKFTRMANKEYTQRTLRMFLKDIQSKFTAKREGDPTPHIDLIRKIQLTIVTSVNEQLKKDKVKLKANSGLVEQCKALSSSFKIKQTKETGTVNVEPLSGTKKKNKLSGLSGLGNLGIVNSQDLATMNFKFLQFDGKFKDLIGNPTIPFHIMIYGLPGSGKSTLAINLAKYLADKQNLKVLFLAREEGISGTTQEKFIRLNAIHQNIDISEKMPESLDKYDVLVIDSVNEMNFAPDHIRQVQAKYPRLSTIQLFKATKEGKFLGQSDFAHLVQAEIRCLDGKAQAQKNRFGGNLEIEI